MGIRSLADRLLHRAGPCLGRDSFILALALSITGCSSLPVMPARNPAETPRLDPGSLAVVAARFEPAGTHGPLLSGKGKSSAKGAAAGGATGALESLYIGAGDPLLAILMLPVMVPIGIIAGAAGGAASGASSEAIENSARAWEQATRAANLQGRLRDQVVATLQGQSVAHRIVAVDALGPTDPDARPDYRTSDADAVLEVSMLEIKFSPYPKQQDEIPYGLAITVRARAIDTKTGTLLDEMHHVIRSPPHSASAWLRDEATLFTRTVDDAMRESAETIVLEFFRLYYPPENLATPRTGLFAAPYYVLQPEYPPPPRWARNTQLSGDLLPTFRWEAFPRAIDLQAAGDAQIAGVTYDLALYTVTENKTPFSVILRCGLSRGFDCPQKPPFTPGPRIYLRTGLEASEHRLETPLQACGQYGWTVRAHFTLDGHPRVTEWSGSYLMHPPWQARRTLLTPGGEQIQQWNVNWFLFRAPAADGSATCPD